MNFSVLQEEQGVILPKDFSTKYKTCDYLLIEEYTVRNFQLNVGVCVVLEVMPLAVAICDLIMQTDS